MRRAYGIVTAAYWADTVTDGALRILVLFYFYQRGYTPLQVAFLFLFYEVFGILTNLVGGWIGARFGLRSTLVAGLAIQISALLMLALAPNPWLVVPYVMASQALSGIAKDLTKMSAKSAVRLLVPDGEHAALLALAVLVGAALVLVLATLGDGLGRPDAKARFTHMLSQTHAVNVLAAARVFLFASRDVWFVVGLPVFLRSVLGWGFWEVGAFLAVWVIGYGAVQAASPRLLRGTPTGRTALWLALALAAFPALIALALARDIDPTLVLVGGLIAFGVVFALNSAVHSFLILRYAHGDKVAMNVGFYYMANAGGRLAGTLLSGLLYQWQGLEACLWASSLLVLGAAAASLWLPKPATGTP